jgi:hypothetical protein
MMPNPSRQINKIGKVCSLGYTDITEVFFTPHHVGRCCSLLRRRAAPTCCSLCDILCKYH